MASTAERLLRVLTHPGVEWVAVTLRCGYAVKRSGERMLFEPCHVEEEKRRSDGRCTKLVGVYKDGSRIVFTWHPTRGARYHAVINGREIK